jgi:integrase
LAISLTHLTQDQTGLASPRTDEIAACSVLSHDVRHTYASIALTAGTHPKVVADRLGHSTIGTTLDTYSHVVQSLEEQAAVRVALVILGGSA